MQKYYKIFTLSMMHTLKNGKALVGLSIFLLVCLVIFSNLWKIIEAKIGASGFNTSELLWYIALNEWVLIALPSSERAIEGDLRSGRLATVLPRPISYLVSQFFESAGELCANLLVLGVVSFGFTWFMVGGLPISAFPVLIGTGILAGVVGTLFQMLIGLTAFWIYEVDPVSWIWEKLLFAFGGLLLPLSVYPAWWQTAARFTPFPYILGYRSALAIDSGVGNILLIISGLVFFGLIALTALCFVYRKGLKILNVEGG